MGAQSQGAAAATGARKVQVGAGKARRVGQDKEDLVLDFNPETIQGERGLLPEALAPARFVVFRVNWFEIGVREEDGKSKQLDDRGCPKATRVARVKPAFLARVVIETDARRHTREIAVTPGLLFGDHGRRRAREGPEKLTTAAA